MNIPAGSFLRGKLASAAATTQPRFYVSYHFQPTQVKDDYSEMRGFVASGVFDDTNTVTLVDGADSSAMPGANLVIDSFQITNRSTATEIFELSTDVSMPRQTLIAEQSWCYERESGFQVVGP